MLGTLKDAKDNIGKYCASIKLINTTTIPFEEGCKRKVSKKLVNSVLVALRNWVFQDL
jgi:hypothetical protein